jgi:lysophospholipase L1-like esterase
VRASASRRHLVEAVDALRDVVLERGGWAVALAEVAGPFFVAQPDAMFAVDRFHPSAAGYRRTAKALLPSVLAALGHGGELPHGHYGGATALRSVDDAG